MLCFDASDTLEGGASVNAVVDYSVHGLLNGIPVFLANGQLSNSDPTVIYTFTDATFVVNISFVNTHTSAVTVNLYHDPLNAGTPRRIIPKNLSLQPGYKMSTDGVNFAVFDTNGGVVVSAAVSDTAYGASWDGDTTHAPSKNAVYDQMQLKLTGSYATAAEITTGTEAAKAIAPDQAVLALMKLSGANLAIGSDADGDMYYRASSALARLAKGTANYKMFMNAAATAPEWAIGFKAVTTTYDVSTTGAWSITGAGFKPSAAIFLANIGQNAAASIGVVDPAGAGGMIENYHNNNADTWNSAASYIMILQTGAGVGSSLAFSSFDADGITVTKAKSGSPTGTANVFVLFLR